MLNPRVTVVSGAQDETVVGPSRSKLRFSSQILPSVFIKSQRPDPFHVVSQTLILLSVSSLPKGMYVFTKDIKQLTADLEAADDQEAVILRYSNALVAKNEVRCESWSDFGFAVLTRLKVCTSVREPGKIGESE